MTADINIPPPVRGTPEEARAAAGKLAKTGRRLGAPDRVTYDVLVTCGLIDVAAGHRSDRDQWGRVKQHKPIAHGTDRGYQQHIRRGETACDDCRTAHADYMRDTYRASHPIRPHIAARGKR